MTKLLFPTDFSTTADNAFVYALQLANTLKADLLVLHTYEMPIISTTSGGDPDLIFDVYEQLELNQFDYYKKHTAKLRTIAEKNNLTNINTDYVFERGILVDIIQRIVEDEKINYLVMGTTGASGIEKKLLGSNTVNVIRGVKIPVFSIPHNAHFAGLQTIGFTTLFKDKDVSAMEEVVRVAEHFKAKIEVIHVTDQPKDDELLTKHAEWQARFPQPFISFNILENKDVEASVFDFMEEKNIDILAMVRRNRNFFDRLFGSSFTKKMSYHIKQPVMVLHEL